MNIISNDGCCRSIDLTSKVAHFTRRAGSISLHALRHSFRFSGILLLGGILLSTAPAWGGTNGGVCMVDRFGSDSPLNCTSNDVSLAIYEVVEGPSECVAGETIRVRLKGDFEATSDSRWDVGVFISEDGGTPNAPGGLCYSDFLHPVSADNTDIDLASGSGPFFNGEITQDPADQCGDIEQGNNATFETDFMDIVCQDNNGDFIADVASCTVWASSRSNGSDKPSCMDESDVTAETTAKCTCSTTNIVGIDFQQVAEIEVVKNLVPVDDPGVFNLQIDAVDEATDVGNAGSTGAVIVGAGTFNHPGASHTVGETAGTGTSLASYFTGIECVDRGLSTFGGFCEGGSAGICDGGGSAGRSCVINDNADACVIDGGECLSGFACDPNGNVSSDACIAGGGVCTANGDSLTLPGAGPLDVPVVPGQDVVCTITNTNGCESTVCEDTACAILACDPTGVTGNCDILTYTPDVICRAGSGDSCDPNEVCIDGQATCPDDFLEPDTTVCNAGSGDICDQDEMCSGIPGEACPDDTFDDGTTVCNAGSGDMCDPEELCPGVADAACPDDTVTSQGTVCNPGSGDVCDPDEVCSGNPDEACPDDTVASQGTVCNPGSGDICDPDEVCSGNPDEVCPDDTVSGQGTLCRPGSNDQFCDVDEFCSGVAEVACPDDDAPGNAGLLCRTGNGVDICDQDELCTGTPGADCPGDDAEINAGLVCRESGTGFEGCDPSEVCLGIPGSICPDDYIEPEGTPCGDQSTTQCTDPDTCDDAGICLNNNKVCGSVTNSALCEYDMEPTKGTCTGGDENGNPCFINDACQQGGGICDVDVCVGGLEDGLACTPPEPGPCEDAGGVCEQSDQFRLLYSPDAQNWTAYRLNASNPGQTFYNIMYDASGAGGDDVTLTVTVPHPYVTVGGMPLHIYDGESVSGNGFGCLNPEEAIRSEPMFITLDDWIFGVAGAGAYNLTCDAVPGPGGAGFCTFEVTVLNSEIPAGGLLYVNLHLDYGFKGQKVDANPYGLDAGTGLPEDRYDRHPYVSPWASSDALANTSTDDGPLAIADCTAYWFDHTDDVTAGYCSGGDNDGLACNDACTDAGGICEVDTCVGGDLDGEACTPIDCSAAAAPVSPYRCSRTRLRT